MSPSQNSTSAHMGSFAANWVLSTYNCWRASFACCNRSKLRASQILTRTASAPPGCCEERRRQRGYLGEIFLEEGPLHRQVPRRGLLGTGRHPAEEQRPAQ